MSDFLQGLWDMAATRPHLLGLLIAGWALYLAVLGVWIVLQKREPVATLSWLLGLALLCGRYLRPAPTSGHSEVR